MTRIATILAAGGLLASAVLGSALPAAAGGDHQGRHMDGAMMPNSVGEMREMHRDHAHGHDFEAMEEMTPAQRRRVMALMHEIGVAMPPMNPERGRRLFAEKGCVACHAVNGVGGDLGPPLDAADMPRPMNAFEFAARMWRGAQAMTALQEGLLGEVVALDGRDLADLIAFAHDEKEQSLLTEDQIPERYHALIAQ